ncbi:MAG: hypothetical protein KDC45_05435 [Bacteroidetes bacterium]|nr:hypothetical protein [Bacteroidota bacterium]
MPISECNSCGHAYHWSWEEAFDKFGFNDGDGQIETSAVAKVLLDAGYQVELGGWFLHNMIILSIQKDGEELIPQTGYELGYDDPRDYLPQSIIDLLDSILS